MLKVGGTIEIEIEISGGNRLCVYQHKKNTLQVEIGEGASTLKR